MDEKNERTRRPRRINGAVPEERWNDTKRMPSKAILPWHLTTLVIKTKSRPVFTSQDQVKGLFKTNVERQRHRKQVNDSLEREQQAARRSHKTRRHNSTSTSDNIIVKPISYLNWKFGAVIEKSDSPQSTSYFEFKFESAPSSSVFDSCLLCEGKRSNFESHRARSSQACSVTSALESFELDLRNLWIFRSLDLWIFVPCSRTRKHPFEWCSGFKGFVFRIQRLHLQSTVYS
jgi:hypothetical protein